MNGKRYDVSLFLCTLIIVVILGCYFPLLLSLCKLRCLVTRRSAKCKTAVFDKHKMPAAFHVSCNALSYSEALSTNSNNNLPFSSMKTFNKIK